MPNWKKLITSGSDAVLNNITASGEILIPSYIEHTGDTDTKIGFSAGNTVVLVTGGSIRLKANNTGAQVTGSLQVSGDLTGSNNLRFNSAGTSTISYDTTLNVTDRYEGSTFAFEGNAFGSGNNTGFLNMNGNGSALILDGNNSYIQMDGTNSYIVGENGFKIGAANNDEYIDFSSDGQIQFKIDNVEDFRMSDGGTFHANADVVAYSSTVSSDERLKTNIVDTKYGLDHILKLESKEFDWKEKLNGRHDIGFIAQQVQEVIPELVKEVDGLNGEDPHLTVDYAKVVPILVNAIKELKDEINELKIK